jgi:hypothetical protein
LGGVEGLALSIWRMTFTSGTSENNQPGPCHGKRHFQIGFEPRGILNPATGARYELDGWSDGASKPCSFKTDGPARVNSMAFVR